MTITQFATTGEASADLLAVTDSVGQGVFTVDHTGRLSYINRAAERMLGWRARDLQGRVMHDVIHKRRFDGSPFPIEECPLTRPRPRSEAVHVTHDVFLRRDGSEMPIEYTAARVQLGSGAAGTVVVFGDAAVNGDGTPALSGR